MQQGLFRQVALERMSSPDQLDRLMRVTDSKGWLALATLAALTLATVLWSIFGSVATTVRGDGAVIREGGTYKVRANTAGHLADLNVKRGDVLSAGQVIARLAAAAGARTEITNPFGSAQVVELLATRDDPVTPDSAVLSVELLDEEILALLYLPATVTAHVEPGMAVQVSPAGVKREEFGFI
ncbi:MAG: biotin/lipoyl-binding protein, partial [Chloroflexi bacterium]|nr:biotin/lipoyl-binding protein [Chloroflexota bacterium]